MIIKTKALVLDLDDTLYSELEYLKSAYNYIANKLSPNGKLLSEKMFEIYQNGENAFEYLAKTYNIDIATLLEWYRNHEPKIELYPGVKDTLEGLSDTYKYAVITDGRSKTQRNKIKALGLDVYFDSVVISEEIGTEKPNSANYEKVMQDLDCNEYIYVGDNLTKDFVTANKYGWKTICLMSQGQNIHKQNIDIPNEYQPLFFFNSWQEIKSFLQVN